MAVLHVNPTRMALMELKRKSASAKRGHKLLKDKQDGLMQQFLVVIRTAKQLREEIDLKLQRAFRTFLLASAWLSESELHNALSSPQATISLDYEIKSVMGVKIPVFKLRKEGTIRSYGYANTNAFLDEAIDLFEETFASLVRLAEIEKQAERMAIELETTRRRVNALEHKMLPDLRDTVKFIKMKLDESERSAIVGTMRVKAQIEAAGR
jgi:V/A-type H+-transporting ATPase subunit D